MGTQYPSKVKHQACCLAHRPKRDCSLAGDGVLLLDPAPPSPTHAPHNLPPVVLYPLAEAADHLEGVAEKATTSLDRCGADKVLHAITKL